MYQAQCTRSQLFCNQAIQNGWVWIHAGDEHTYGTFRGHLPARLICLFKFRSLYMQQDMVFHLARVQFLSVVDSGHLSDTHSFVTLQFRDVTQVLTIVDIGTILGLAHLIPEIDPRLLVNS